MAKKCKKTCNKCPTIPCPGDTIPNGDGDCLCPGNTIDYGNGNCSCPGDTVIDEVGHCSCPGDTVNDGLGTCSCPENTMNDGDGNCIPTNPGGKCCETAKVKFKQFKSVITSVSIYF